MYIDVYVCTCLHARRCICVHIHVYMHILIWLELLVVPCGNVTDAPHPDPHYSAGTPTPSCSEVYYQAPKPYPSWETAFG